MPTCSYCEQRKGKRSCPALAGPICSQCCGQHRLADIVCPSDCMYLGGLAVIGDPTLAAAGFTPAEYDAAWHKLHAYAEGISAFRHEAFSRCFEPPEEPEPWAADVALGYLYYGHCDPGRRRLIDHFLAIRGRGLAPGEVAAMLAVQGALASLFEVTAVQAGAGLELRDLLTGELVRVADVAASGQLKKWDVVFTWLMNVRGRVEMTGAGCLVPRPHLARVRAALDGELVNARIERPGLPDRELVGSLAWSVIRGLREAVRGARMPALHTSDGEELVDCKARYAYAIDDEAAVRAALAGNSELEAEGSAYRWSRAADPASGPGTTTLGHVQVAGGELVLETMSRERNARGKQLLERTLGALIAHREDSAEPFDAALGPPGQRSVHAAEHVPGSEERALVGEYLQDYYRKWLDIPVPMLDDKTPREVARTERGRAQVEEMLKDIENTSSKIPGGEAIDYAALRRELDLDPGEPQVHGDGGSEGAAGGEPPSSGDAGDAGDAGDGVLGYDAERAPEANAWLVMDDDEKARAVEHYHDALAMHPTIGDARIHALSHVIVENQLAGGEPPFVGATLLRLFDGGLTRHEAIHAIAAVMWEAMQRIVRDKTEFDRDATARALDDLQPENWRSTPAG